MTTMAVKGHAPHTHPTRARSHHAKRAIFTGRLGDHRTKSYTLARLIIVGVGIIVGSAKFSFDDSQHNVKVKRKGTPLWVHTA